MKIRRVFGVPAPAPHQLRRERLLEILHRHGSRPLILLVAPAGFGKSTLAAEYARGSGAVVAWITLDAGDRGSRALFERVADALESAFGEPDLLPELRRGLRGGAEGVGLTRLLVSDLAQAPAGFILVLDDFHAVADAEEVLQSVDALVRGLPEMGQLVITAREPPALAMTRLVASDAVFALGTEDLRFTPDEVAALRRALGGDPTHDAQAEGWIAGILLGGAPRQLSAVGGTLLGSYVDREVLARLRPAEQRWLETLAVLETITPAAAGRLLGEGPWAARLAVLAERCPFLTAGEGGSFRLHALVRESLLNRLRRAHPGHATRAWSIARQLAEEAFDTPGVVRACQELGRSADAVALVRRTAEAAVEPGRWAAVLATLDLLPAPVRLGDPGLCLLEAEALLQTGRPEPARQAAEAALRHGGRSGDVSVQVSALIELANIACYTGDLTAADDWLSAADYLLPSSGLPAPRRRSLQGRALRIRGVRLAMQGETAEARAALESAERLLALNGPSRELAVVQNNLGTLCTRVGDTAGARAALAAATTHLRLAGDRALLAANQCQLGNLCLHSGELDGASAVLTGALAAAREVGALRLEAHTLILLGEWHRASGRIGDAVAQVDSALRLAEEVGERELLVSALALRAELGILQDDLPTARELLARAQAEAQRLGADFQLAGVARALGRLHLAEGAGHRAISHLEGALRRGATVWGPAERLATLYWLGTAHLALGRARQAETALREALALAEQAGGAGVLASPVSEDPRLLHHGLQMGVDPLALAEVERIAATRQPWTGVHQPAALELVARNEQPRLEARLFGAFALHRDGELVETGARRHVDRARELFALLVLHPNGLPDREIVELLWPDMALQRALHNLQMAAYLLRRLLGSKAAVRYGAAVYQLAPQLELWADVRAFDAALIRARGAPADAARAALETAVELYRGPLLADVGWPWVEVFRLGYQARFVDAALRLADLLATADPARSDGLAEQVLAVEPGSEAAYERLIRNAQARGDPLAARRAARRYELAASRLGLATNPSLVRALH